VVTNRFLGFSDKVGLHETLWDHNSTDYMILLGDPIDSAKIHVTADIGITNYGKDHIILYDVAS